MPDNRETSNHHASNSTVLKTVAGIAIGAAVALGAYFLGKEEGQVEAKQSYQERVQYAQNMSHKTETKCTDNDGDEKISKDCDICKTSFKQLIDRGMELHLTPCGHIFCKQCIDTALQIFARCPACNEDVARRETHRIFL